MQLAIQKSGITIATMTKAVLDTNVLVAALKSRAGASFRVLRS